MNGNQTMERDEQKNKLKFFFLIKYCHVVSIELTRIVHEQPVAHGDNKGIYCRTGVEYPVEMMQATLLRLPHYLKVLALHHHALRHNPSGQPCLHRAEEQPPVGQVNPPLGIVMLEVLLSATDVQQRANQCRQAGYGRYPTIEQINNAHLSIALPLCVQAIN